MINNEIIEKYRKNIPLELQKTNQWLLYKSIKEIDKNGVLKTKKLPYSAITLSAKNWNKKENWISFDDAINVLEKHSFNGLSFILTKDDPYICIDLDKSINYDIKPLAKDILKRFSGTYIELSQSKNGLHIFIKGEVESNINNGEHKIEIYDSNKCISLTGNIDSKFFDKSNSILEFNKDINELYSIYAPKKSIRESICKFKNENSNYIPSVNTIIEVMKKYNNQAFSLFNGTYSSGDPSRDDFRLLLFLNSFTHGNANLMKEIFLQSALNRIGDKSKRSNENSYLRYLDLSIEKAISKGNNNYWDYSYYKKGGTCLE